MRESLRLLLHRSISTSSVLFPRLAGTGQNTCDRISRGVNGLVTSPQQPQPSEMLRAPVNFTSALTRGLALKRTGNQLAKRKYVATAPIRRSNFILYAGLAGTGIGLHAYSLNNIRCDGMISTLITLRICVYTSPEPTSKQAPSTGVTPPRVPKDSGLPPQPASSLNLYELTFGSICGICAGVFIKKGAKFVAFILGGTFVLLQVISISPAHVFILTPFYRQYLGSVSIVRVDWSRAASRFENLFYRTENGVRRPPTVGSLWSWLINFLTADFQPRATFAAGLVLGLRIG